MVEGNVNGDIFLNFVQRCLLSVMLPFDGDNPRSVLVMDNAAIHHVEADIDLLTAAGILIRFLPPYSPDLNPIEEAFGKVKTYINDNEIAYQSTRNPRVLVSNAFASITSHSYNQLMYMSSIIPHYNLSILLKSTSLCFTKSSLQLL